MDENSQYRELFFEETADHLENLNDAIMELESNPTSSELIDSIFRSAHTLKGMAATMGYESMTKLTHKMENIFQLVKDQEIEVTHQVISLILESLDCLDTIVEDLKIEIETDISIIQELIERLDHLNPETQDTSDTEKATPESTEFFQHLNETEKMMIDEAQDNGFEALGLKITLDESCTMKGPRVYLILNSLESMGELVHCEPEMEKLENGEFDQAFTLLFFTKETAETIVETIKSDIDVAQVELKKMTPIDEENIVEEATAPEVETVVQSDKQAEPGKTVVEKNDKPKEKPRQNQSIKVDLDRLDTFMNLVSELVVYRTRLENLSHQFNATEIQDPLGQVGRITSELQDLVLKIRMQQVSVVTNRFPKMVRNLSRDLGKEMNLIIEGEETELDRTVVTELSEPLIHLIRNSADHGIESKERRLELGKPEIGQIKLTACQQGNRVIITLSDDGKGLDPEMLARKAQEKGIEIDGMSEKEILNIIFHPGFSTAQEVTNVSGRGVGMDVVHSKIESLGGSIELASEVNRGTEFTINLPLTLSIIQSLMVKVMDQTFALPLGVIEKVISISEEDLISVHQTEIYTYRGKATPVIRIKDVLGFESNEVTTEKHLIMILLGKKHYALLVDELIGQQEIVIKKLGKELGHLKNYLGATILGNGDVTLILDINAICNESTGDAYGKVD